MIHWLLPDILKHRKLTAYGLAKSTGLTVQAAYRLADPKRSLQRLDIETLDTLCRVLKVSPGELLEYKAKRGKG